MTDRTWSTRSCQQRTLQLGTVWTVRNHYALSGDALSLSLIIFSLSFCLPVCLSLSIIFFDFLIFFFSRRRFIFSGYILFFKFLFSLFFVVFCQSRMLLLPRVR